MASFAQATDSLDPAEGFFDDFAALETLGIVFAASDAAIDGTAGLFTGHMGFDVLRIELVDERRLVVAFVGTDAAAFGNAAFDHFLGGFDFGGAGGLGGFDIDDQAVAILGQGVGDVAQFGLGVFAFLVKPGFGIGRALVGGVASLFAAEVDLGIAAGGLVRTAAVFLDKAFVRSPGFGSGCHRH